MKLSNHVFMMHRQCRSLSDTFLITLLLITSRSRKIYRSKHDKYNKSLSLVIHREIFIPYREIGRFSLFYQKSGDLPQNRETWKLCLLTITQTNKLLKHKRNCCTQPASVYRRYCHWSKIAALFMINLGILFLWRARRRASS